VVLFCHNTSRVETDPYPSLLGEKGGSGFPYLVFMDQNGNVIAKHQGNRSVEAFQTTMGRADEFLALEKKAASGERDAKLDLFLQQLELRHFNLEQANAKRKELGQLPEETSKKVDGLLIGLEVSQIVGKIQDRKEIAKVGGPLVKMFEAGRIPTGSDARMFWSVLLMYAEETKDIPLFEKLVARLEQDAGDDPRAKAMAESAKKRLEKLRE